MTPQVGKWYMTLQHKAVKIVSRDSSGWFGNNDALYNADGRIRERWHHPEDLDMERGPIEPTTEELALYALRLLWDSFDNAGDGSFQWTPEEVYAVKEALVKAGRIKP